MPRYRQIEDTTLNQTHRKVLPPFPGNFRKQTPVSLGGVVDGTNMLRWERRRCYRAAISQIQMPAWLRLVNTITLKRNRRPRVRPFQCSMETLQNYRLRLWQGHPVFVRLFRSEERRVGK